MCVTFASLLRVLRLPALCLQQLDPYLSDLALARSSVRPSMHRLGPVLGRHVLNRTSAQGQLQAGPSAPHPRWH